MIISRTPFRVSFVGGGSDLPSYYSRLPGKVISMAINRYVYVSVNKSFSDTVRVAYSKVEECKNFSEIEHPIVRNIANFMNLDTGVEITSTADIPAKGSGLGSSSSFTVGLLNAITNYLGMPISKDELAQSACQVEISLCKEPIGKQDQYAAAFGGFNEFKFNTDGSVERKKLEILPFAENHFINSLMFFYTGLTRQASSILGDQNKATLMRANDLVLSKMVDLVPEFGKAMQAANIELCGEILNENWVLKKQLSDGITNLTINDIYNEAMSAGALGGKLLGAGAGGFMLFIAPREKHFAIKNSLCKLQQKFWNVERTGTTIIHQS